MAKMTRADPRIAQTRGLLIEAMEELLRDKPGHDVTVSALCEKAGVSRPTFYQHFRSTDEVLAAALEHRLERIRELADKARVSRVYAPSDVPRVLSRYLEEIWKDRHLYRGLMQPVSPYNHSRVVMATWLEQSVAEFLFEKEFDELERETRDRVTFAVGGFAATVARWLESGDSRKSDLARFGPFLWRAVTSVIESPRGG